MVTVYLFSTYFYAQLNNLLIFTAFSVNWFLQSSSLLCMLVSRCYSKKVEVKAF